MNMKAVCPDADWKTAGDRYNVARRAVQIIEAWATEHNLTVDAIAETLVDRVMTIADGIAMHTNPGAPDYDPRTDGFAEGQSFYAFKFRINDAVQILTSVEKRKAAEAKRIAEDAAWAAKGLERCGRCDGAGGRADWPSWQCFECDGRRFVEIDHKN